MIASLDRNARSGVKRFARIVPMLAMVFLVASSNAAIAQSFKKLDPKIDDREAKQMRGQVALAFRNPAGFQENKQVLDDYFNKYYFPKMTLPSQLAQLGKARENLLKYIRLSKVPAAQQHLTNLSLAAMRVMAQGNFHPAVRYNAVLVLGSLDEKVAGTGPAATAPVPLPASTKELLDLLENDEFNDVKVPPSVKLGALVGLERHARFGVDAQYSDRLTKATLAIATQEEPPADLDSEVHHWIKCQAARILVRQFAEGPNAEVQAALMGMIADANMGLEDRCCVAELLQNIKYDQAAGIEMAATVTALGNLTKSVTSDEAEKANEFQQEMLRGSGRGVFGGPPLTYQRRRLISRLGSIVNGANSVSKGLPDADRQQLTTLLSALQPILDFADDKDAEDLEITPKVIDLNDQVRSLVDSWKPAASEEPAELPPAEQPPAEQPAADLS